jgi:hypothetical protein
MRYIVNFVKGFNLFRKSRAPYIKLLNGKVVLYKNTVYEMHSTGNIMVEMGFSNSTNHGQKMTLSHLCYILAKKQV